MRQVELFPWDKEVHCEKQLSVVMDYIFQVVVPVFAGDCRQIYIPIEPIVTGDIGIPVRAMSFLGGHTITHKVSVGVSLCQINYV